MQPEGGGAAQSCFRQSWRVAWRDRGGSRGSALVLPSCCPGPVPPPVRRRIFRHGSSQLGLGLVTRGSPWLTVESKSRSRPDAASKPRLHPAPASRYQRGFGKSSSPSPSLPGAPARGARRDPALLEAQLPRANTCPQPCPRAPVRRNLIVPPAAGFHSPIATTTSAPCRGQPSPRFRVPRLPEVPQGARTSPAPGNHGLGFVRAVNRLLS